MDYDYKSASRYREASDAQNFYLQTLTLNNDGPLDRDEINNIISGIQHKINVAEWQYKDADDLAESLRLHYTLVGLEAQLKVTKQYLKYWEIN